MSEKPTLEANVVRELAATVVKRAVALRHAQRTGKLRVVKKLYERTKGEVEAKNPGFKKMLGGRLKLTVAAVHQRAAAHGHP